MQILFFVFSLASTPQSDLRENVKKLLRLMDPMKRRSEEEIAAWQILDNDVAKQLVFPEELFLVYSTYLHDRTVPNRGRFRDQILSHFQSFELSRDAFIDYSNERETSPLPLDQKKGPTSPHKPNKGRRSPQKPIAPHQLQDQAAVAAQESCKSFIYKDKIEIFSLIFP